MAIMKMKSNEEANYEKIIEMLNEQNKAIKEVKEYLNNIENIINDKHNF